MPQLSQVSQRRFLWGPFPPPNSGACRPLIPNHGDHRFRSSGKIGRHASERLDGIARNRWTASVGTGGRHGPDYATVEEAVAKTEEAVEEISRHLVFGHVPPKAKAKKQRATLKVKVLYFRNLPNAEEDQDKSTVRAIEQPVQLSMFMV